MRWCLCVVCVWNAIVWFSGQQLISYSCKTHLRISDGKRVLRMQQLTSVTVCYHQTHADTARLATSLSSSFSLIGFASLKRKMVCFIFDFKISRATELLCQQFPNRKHYLISFCATNRWCCKINQAVKLMMKSTFCYFNFTQNLLKTRPDLVLNSLRQVGAKSKTCSQIATCRNLIWRKFSLKR